MRQLITRLGYPDPVRGFEEGEREMQKINTMINAWKVVYLRGRDGKGKSD